MGWVQYRLGKSITFGDSCAWLLMRDILGKSKRGNQFDDIARLTGLGSRLQSPVYFCYNITQYFLVCQ